MATLIERAKEALENVERIQAGNSAKGSLADRGLARHLGQAEYELERLSKDLARALIAAEELADAVLHERTMVCQDMGLQIEASNAVDRALTAYRKAKGDQS